MRHEIRQDDRPPPDQMDVVGRQHAQETGARSGRPGGGAGVETGRVVRQVVEGVQEVPAARSARHQEDGGARADDVRHGAGREGAPDVEGPSRAEGAGEGVLGGVRAHDDAAVPARGFRREGGRGHGRDVLESVGGAVYSELEIVFVARFRPGVPPPVRPSGQAGERMLALRGVAAKCVSPALSVVQVHNIADPRFSSRRRGPLCRVSPEQRHVLRPDVHRLHVHPDVPSADEAPRIIHEPQKKDRHVEHPGVGVGVAPHDVDEVHQHDELVEPDAQPVVRGHLFDRVDHERAQQERHQHQPVHVVALHRDHSFGGVRVHEMRGFAFAQGERQRPANNLDRVLAQKHRKQDAPHVHDRHHTERDTDPRVDAERRGLVRKIDVAAHRRRFREVLVGRLHHGEEQGVQGGHGVPTGHAGDNVVRFDSPRALLQCKPVAPRGVRRRRKALPRPDVGREAVHNKEGRAGQKHRPERRFVADSLPHHVSTQSSELILVSRNITV
mmetsp:Transcript_5243/g.11041  ORF Transcript_5243/g.11041 Transcript_5243/m.11041 type:complete len:499 (-) Transcript_5243:124-1620(-)